MIYQKLSEVLKEAVDIIGLERAIEVVVEAKLNSESTISIPCGLSREDKRKFIISNKEQVL